MIYFTQIGVTQSELVESGIWFPYDVAKKAVATTDAEVASMGYLYSTNTAFGFSTDGDIISIFEGVQGICPDGWHIPTQAEAQALLDAYWDADTQKGAPLTALQSAGFSTTLGGFRQKNTSIATALYSTAMPGYILCSTNYSYKVNEETGAVSSMNKAILETNNATFQRMTVANASNFGGSNIRCIKD